MTKKLLKVLLLIHFFYCKQNGPAIVNSTPSNPNPNPNPSDIFVNINLTYQTTCFDKNRSMCPLRLNFVYKMYFVFLKMC